MDHNLVENRTSKLIGRMLRSSALNIEQPYCRKYIPGSELALIFVLSVSISMLSVCAVEFVTDQAHPFLAKCRFAGEIEEPWLMQAENRKRGI